MKPTNQIGPKMRFWVPLILSAALLGCDGGGGYKPAPGQPYNPEGVSASSITGVKAIIEAGGYTCPRVSYIRPRGMTPLGGKFEVYCGPDDGTGNTYSALHYAVYPERLQANVCGPSSADMGHCA